MKKAKKPLGIGKKLLIALTVLALVIGAAYLGYYLVRFTTCPPTHWKKERN